MYRYLSAICFFFTATFIHAQSVYKKNIDDSTLSLKGSVTLMPYNRLLQSAGKVINYGDPELENHTLDVCVLPNKKSIFVNRIILQRPSILYCFGSGIYNGYAITIFYNN